MHTTRSTILINDYLAFTNCSLVEAKRCNNSQFPKYIFFMELRVHPGDKLYSRKHRVVLLNASMCCNRTGEGMAETINRRFNIECRGRKGVQPSETQGGGT